MYHSDRHLRIVHKSFEETYIDESVSSFSEVSSLWTMISIKCILNLEVSMKKLLMKKWTALENSARNPVDCYRHFITDESISLMFRATNQHVEQCLQTHKLSRRSNIRQWKSTIDEEMPMFLRIIIEIGLV